MSPHGQPTGPRIPYTEVSRPCTHKSLHELDPNRFQGRPGGSFEVTAAGLSKGDAAYPSGAGVQRHWPRSDTQQHVDVTSKNYL